MIECDKTRAPRLAVTVSVGGRKYGLNGAAKDAGYPTAAMLIKNVAPDTKFVKPVTRKALPDRKAVFAALGIVRRRRIGCD